MISINNNFFFRQIRINILILILASSWEHQENHLGWNVCHFLFHILPLLVRFGDHNLKRTAIYVKDVEYGGNKISALKYMNFRTQPAQKNCNKGPIHANAFLKMHTFR